MTVKEWLKNNPDKICATIYLKINFLGTLIVRKEMDECLNLEIVRIEPKKFLSYDTRLRYEPDGKHFILYVKR